MSIDGCISGYIYIYRTVTCNLWFSVQAVEQKLAFEEDKAEHIKQMADKDQTIENMKSSNEELR